MQGHEGLLQCSLAGWRDSLRAVIGFAAYQAGRALMRKRLENFREWLTPRRRLWIGIGLFAISIIVPMMSPGTNVSFLVGPACIFFLGAVMPVSNGKR